MNRIFSVRAVYAYRKSMNFYDFKPLNCCINYYDKVGRYQQLSTLHKLKTIYEPGISRNKAEVKLKAKPYQQLLKVLEARERNLEGKSQSKIEASVDDSQGSIILNSCGDRICTSENHPIKPSEKTVLDSISNEGVFAVKPSLKKKKKNADKPPKIDKESEKSKATKAKDKLSAKQELIKRSTRRSYALRALKSCIEVNINANEVEKAQLYLRRQMSVLIKKYQLQNLSDVELYNLLISGWARRGRIDRIKHLFSLMKQDNLSPNLQSYAHYLEGFSNSLDVKEIQLVVDEMKSKGFAPGDILKKCIFKGDQRERIIKVLGFVGSDISPSPLVIGEAYSCKLLQQLNNKSFGRGERFPSVCYEEKDIPFLAANQLEAETQYSLRITSVDAISKANAMTLKSRKYLDECMEMWRKKLTEAIKHFKNIEKNCHLQGFHKEEVIYPYIAVVDTEILVNIMLQQIRVMAETGEHFSPSEKILYKDMGSKVMNHYFIWLSKTNLVTDKVLLVYKEYMRYLLDPKLMSEYSPREYWEFLKDQYPSGPTLDIANVPWPYGVLVKIGSELYDIMQKNVAFDTNKMRQKASNKSSLTPAFFVVYEDEHDGNDMKISKHIVTHHLLCKLYRDAKLDYLEFDVSVVPMLSPPKPWVKYDSGGFLITPTPFIRFNENAIHQTTYYSTVPSKQLNPCFDSLNNLSLCPWIINKPVLDLIIDIFQKGGDAELDVPINPNTFSAAPKFNSSMSKKEKAIIWKQKKELKKLKCEASSLWFDGLYKLSIANNFRDKVFWFPHNLDFRGRTYPTPPHFNHLGSDLIRSILLFAEGQPLGKNGLDWLKIQLINLTAFKKGDPHCVRLAFANEKMSDILDSADRPFEGRQWWKTSDKPWQTLALCKELANALRHPNPEEYVSHFPIHQDGSCNGLQHYAALGRDQLGAVEVNLYPSDAPQDVYTGVSALVERERQKDAANGLEVAQKLEGFVRRKVVKQTVMTFVYGVTKFGAKLQILKQLKDIPEFDEKYHHEASLYLMQKIFFSIKEMFTATQEIQDWFTDCAEHITRVSGEPLEWVTPLGLPVIQPYHKEIILNSSKFSMQGKESCLKYTSHFEPYQLPNIRKQKNGFAPNFIHSLDASHMMLTSLFCQRHGITFVSVHDCYWTHASTVEIMNKICRQQFVSLHKEQILEDLSIFFLDKYARVVDEQIQGKKLKLNSAKMKLRELLSTVPKKGTFNLEKVMESEYFFS